MVEFVERSWKNGSRAVPNTPLVIFYFFQGRFRFRPYNMKHHKWQRRNFMRTRIQLIKSFIPLKGTSEIS
jgi:hypothetical protein